MAKVDIFLLSQPVKTKNGDAMKFSNSFIIFILLLFAASFAANAAPTTTLNSHGLLDDILGRYGAVASTWKTVITQYASYLFWSLVLISMVWTFGMMALQADGGIASALAELVRFFVVAGFFYWLLINGPAISMSIQDSLRQLAAKASGFDKGLSPSDIVDIGFHIAERVADQSSVWSPADSTVGLLMAAVILCVLALVGVNMLLLLITGWILSYAGIIMLGLGGARWTSDMAINFFKTVLNVGLQLFTMVLIVGIGKSFIDSYYQAMGDDVIQIKDMFVMLVSSIILLVLVNKVPQMIGNIAGGATTGGIGGFGAGALVGAAAAAGAAIATAGAAAAAGTAGAAGGASALKAAFESAQAAMAEESGSGGSGGGMGGGEDTGSVNAAESSSADSGGSGGSGDGNAAEGSAAGTASGAGASGAGGSDAGKSSGTGKGSKGFAASFSRAGRMASHMAGSLSKGMAAQNAEKHGAKMSAAQEAIAQTSGGKLAAQIRQQSADRQGGSSETNGARSMVADEDALQGAFVGDSTAEASEATTSETSDENTAETSEEFGGDSLSGADSSENQADANTGSDNDAEPEQYSDEYQQFINKQSF